MASQMLNYSLFLNPPEQFAVNDAENSIFFLIFFFLQVSSIWKKSICFAGSQLLNFILKNEQQWRMNYYSKLFLTMCLTSETQKLSFFSLFFLIPKQLFFQN